MPGRDAGEVHDRTGAIAFSLRTHGYDDHIALQDPARTLRRVETSRVLLDEYEEVAPWTPTAPTTTSPPAARSDWVSWYGRWPRRTPGTPITRRSGCRGSPSDQASVRRGATGHAGWTGRLSPPLCSPAEGSQPSQRAGRNRTADTDLVRPHPTFAGTPATLPPGRRATGSNTMRLRRPPTSAFTVPAAAATAVLLAATSASAASSPRTRRGSAGSARVRRRPSV